MFCSDLYERDTERGVNQRANQGDIEEAFIQFYFIMSPNNSNLWLASKWIENPKFIIKSNKNK